MAFVRSALLYAAVCILTAQSAAAQRHDSHPQAAPAGPALPYAGLERRAVKSLSEQQVADLKAGRGMGLAIPAELNGYPGPSHVLELAEALGLSTHQRIRTQALFDAMKGEAVPIGERVIAAEAALDDLFAGKRAAPATIHVATARVGTAQAELRAAHLRYHVSMLEVLTPAQIVRYGELRGYAARDAGQTHRH